MGKNYKQIYAIEKKNKERLLIYDPDIPETSGIYFLTRFDEENFRYAYIGQAKHILTRLAQHLNGFQHIDLSLKKHGFFSDKNLYGWSIGYLEYPVDKLDEMEQHWIKKYAESGYQLRNKTSGSQGEGKRKIDDYKPARGYHDGLEQGYKNASKEMSHLFDLHLEFKPKRNPPTVNQVKAMEKFRDFFKLS